jgi:hypothetical protein
VPSYVLRCTLFLFFTLATADARLGIDLNGKPIQNLASPNTLVVALFFAASDCPISNRYAPEIKRLQQEFSSRHVALWWVFPNPADTVEIAREHQRQFSVESNTIIDTEQKLVRMAHVTTTPESAVFVVNNGRLNEVYHGRVDDRYLSIGQERTQPAHHDLEDAISSALDNKPVSHPVTPAVGCSIVPLLTAR